MRRWLPRLLLLAGIAAIILFVRRRSSAAKAPAAPAWPPFDNAERRSRVAPSGISSIPEDVPPSQRWSDPVDKACPAGFDVKVKLASGIYHLPGMFAYERTIPDRCYASPDAAEADGFRAAKRWTASNVRPMRVVVDFDVCASTGACMQTCPEVFEVRSDGYLYILQEEPGEALWPKVREAAELCPTGAISLEE